MKIYFICVLFLFPLGLKGVKRSNKAEFPRMSHETEQKLLEGKCPLFIKKNQTPQQVLMKLKYNIRTEYCPSLGVKSVRDYYQLTVQEQEQIHHINRRISFLPPSIAQVPVSSSGIIWLP